MNITDYYITTILVLVLLSFLVFGKNTKDSFLSSLQVLISDHEVHPRLSSDITGGQLDHGGERCVCTLLYDQERSGGMGYLFWTAQLPDSMPKARCLCVCQSSRDLGQCRRCA